MQCFIRKTSLKVNLPLELVELDELELEPDVVRLRFLLGFSSALMGFSSGFVSGVASMGSTSLTSLLSSSLSLIIQSSDFGSIAMVRSLTFGAAFAAATAATAALAAVDTNTGSLIGSGRCSNGFSSSTFKSSSDPPSNFITTVSSNRSNLSV